MRKGWLKIEVVDPTNVRELEAEAVPLVFYQWTIAFNLIILQS